MEFWPDGSVMRTNIKPKIGNFFGDKVTQFNDSSHEGTKLYEEDAKKLIVLLPVEVAKSTLNNLLYTIGTKRSLSKYEYF